MGKQKVYLDKGNESNFTCMTESDTRLLISFGDSDAVEYTTNIQEANYIFIQLGKPYDSASISEFSDVITNLRSYNPSATIVISGGMFHADESDNNHSLGVYSDIMAAIDSNCVALTLNHNYKYIESDNIRYYDFVFNRSRMSYFDHDNEYFKRMCHSTQWPLTYKGDMPYADAEAYQLADFTIDARNSQHRYNLGVLKTFLSSMYAREETIYSKNNSGHAMAGLNDPNIFLVRDAVRIDLKNQLKHYPGFVGGDGSWLATDGDTSSQLKQTLTCGFANNAPPSKMYFESSVVSIYVETVLTNPDIFCVSEKTFVPLIQGHFILPFGVDNFVSKLIREYDVKIPDWIDWQYYDSEVDNLTRWLKYKATVFNTLNKGEDFLWDYKMSEKGQRILRHNRDLFTRNKDSLLSAINT
jgi:hypothetical protein